jgi:hypothetical protein
MVQEIYYSRAYVWIRRIVLAAHGMSSNICWKIHSSSTYVQIRKIILVSLCGVSDLSNIMLNYLDGV